LAPIPPAYFWTCPPIYGGPANGLSIDSWSLNAPGGSVGMDTLVTKSGQTAIQMTPNAAYYATQYGGPAADELDGQLVSIAPGDTLYFSAYVWTASGSLGNSGYPYGGHVEVDMFGPDGRICGIDSTDGTPLYPTYPASDTATCVPPNSGGWVKVTYDFTVASQYEADPWNYVTGGGYAEGKMVTPTGFVMCINWCSSNPSAESTTTPDMWIYGTVLTVTPP